MRYGRNKMEAELRREIPDRKAMCDLLGAGEPEALWGHLRPSCVWAPALVTISLTMARCWARRR